MMRNYPELTQEEQERQKNDAAILLDNSRVYITVWERWESEYKVIKRTELPNNVLRWLQDERKAYGGAYTYAVRWGTDPLTPVVVWEQIYHYCDAELNRLLADPPPIDSAPPAPPPGNKDNGERLKMKQATAARIGIALMKKGEPLHRWKQTDVICLFAEQFRNERGETFRTLEKAFQNDNPKTTLTGKELTIYEQVKELVVSHKKTIKKP